ncbi:HAD family hydrolase [Blastochloris viridis]|uniref:Phosphoglycolate phosphatase n=1 Tax=Blastochloris viridis TaxID=1079 RepID=A0A0H5BCW1_BLAVI|nr:HAD family hydrolase [Blastochloris viridis]BAR98126.1 phosphoglycolate phosphatase [Blastochloris viridis]CUU41249.1 Phosphoglycolate phosphatase [Blastochloris viridis]
MSLILPPLAVFDLDGTLVDTLPDLIDVLADTLNELGLPPLSVEEGRRLVGAGIKPLIVRALAELGRDTAADELERIYADYIDAYSARIARLSRPYPGMEAALDRLAGQGFRFAVCTNKVTALAVQLLTELKLIDRFAAVAGCDRFAMRKPDAGHLWGTIADAGGDPTRTVMVGDSRTDVATARNAALPVVAVSFGYSDVPPEDLGADRLIDHFDSLPQAIGELLGSAGHGR